MEVFVKLNHDEGQTIVLVTHEANIAVFANRQVHLHDGVIAKDFLTDKIEAHI